MEVPALRAAEHTCASRHPHSHPTFQVLDFLHVNLQLLFELLLVLLQLFHQFFKVLKAEGSSVRTDLILPWRAGAGSGAQPGSQAAIEEARPRVQQEVRPKQPAAPQVWTHEVADGSQCSLSPDGRLLWAQAAWCPAQPTVL